MTFQTKQSTIESKEPKPISSPSPKKPGKRGCPKGLKRKRAYRKSSPKWASKPKPSVFSTFAPQPDKSHVLPWLISIAHELTSFSNVMAPLTTDERATILDAIDILMLKGLEHIDFPIRKSFGNQPPSKPE